MPSRAKFVALGLLVSACSVCGVSFTVASASALAVDGGVLQSWTIQTNVARSTEAQPGQGLRDADGHPAAEEIVSSPAHGRRSLDPSVVDPALESSRPVPESAADASLSDATSIENTELAETALRLRSVPAVEQWTDPGEVPLTAFDAGQPDAAVVQKEDHALEGDDVDLMDVHPG